MIKETAYPLSRPYSFDPFRQNFDIAKRLYAEGVRREIARITLEAYPTAHRVVALCTFAEGPGVDRVLDGDHTVLGEYTDEIDVARWEAYGEQVDPLWLTLINIGAWNVGEDGEYHLTIKRPRS